MIDKETIYLILESISDPEIPVLSIIDLGIVRDVIVKDDSVIVAITPTYSGCPAMDMIANQIKMQLLINGYQHVEIQEVLSPAWTTDWMSNQGKQKLKEYGISPPSRLLNAQNQTEVICPRCDSTHTELISEFGSTACKSMYKCLDCLEPFDYFKCH
ncbi:MAG: phenylacetate-CoA oxygenase subunit PaaJ [Chitinophagaceae bacterium]|mgnify:CR=1 FL=1|nr:MAG: phenylacetate-CoA oxygenase subunit PaaJ [Bacteroidetes bacterium OLB11]MCC6447878.1 phenylacetate-CoA oxygenase subunit PaaJ [Chitinophagaceae bacterium]HMN33660.1 phenylacetate-CoA oxygenase subunit PaaJ [Chitinophagaceae bacterium]